ncbi:hypothetical protein PRUPE_7G209000 [Prunus persica]|uniref:LOB domain-containing protein n=1 Tax=Prunus persica TaxID=3760 RepID=A0A251NEM8_PRUPE|nr:hypothetical protein PRUPE_7G209000 [Prunus persica]
MENRDQGAAQNHACASCKQQRRKCDETCEMAPYFLASRYSEFQNAHKIFGVSNIQKIMAMAAPDQRQAAAESILTEGNARKNDPLNGCLGIIRGLNAQIQGLERELHIMKQHLELCKEKEELDGKKNQSKEEDLQHDQSDGLNSLILPDLRLGRYLEHCSKPVTGLLCALDVRSDEFKFDSPEYFFKNQV